MTKYDLSTELNNYKTEYNKYSQKVDDYSNAIKSFQEYQHYFSSRATKCKNKKNIYSTLLAISLPVSILLALFSFPLATIVFALTVGFTERTMFYNKIFKKFDHCSNYMQNIVTNLTNKQNTYIENKNLTMDKIIAINNILLSSKTNSSSHTASTEEELNYSI